MLPYLEAKLAQARAANNAAEVARIAEMQAYWKEVHPQLARLGRQETDAFKIWQGLRDLHGIRQTTGGRSVPQLLKDLTLHLMSIGGSTGVSRPGR
ncbi:MAG: hypothetical protein Q8N47_26635 [Bryobacterales bacterium]|nr:hypothetical protein [Bryobacterales bacterium]